MKFTKEEAVKELTAKYKPRYGEPAKWERTINESVEHAMKLIGEESEIELDDFIGNVMPFLETTAGFVLKETSDVANGFNSQLEDLKKQLEQPKPKNEPTNPNEDLLKRLEALEQERAESQRSQAVAAKRGAIVQTLKEKGVKDTQWIDLMLGKANITPDTDVEKESGDYLDLYNKMFAGRVDDDTPLTPRGDTTNRVKAAIEEAAAIAKERLA